MHLPLTNFKQHEQLGLDAIAKMSKFGNNHLLILNPCTNLQAEELPLIPVHKVDWRCGDLLDRSSQTSFPVPLHYL